MPPSVAASTLAMKPALTLVLLLAWLGTALAAPEKPNVVLIFCDDLGYADLGCYGSQNIRTPNLDRMASEGARFTDFYVAASVCTPSRAALMTGCYAKRLGLQHRVLFPYSDEGLNPEEITLAEVLKEQGYATGCFGKWHLGHTPEFLPPAQGFDEYRGIPYSNDIGNPFYSRNSKGEDIGFVAPPLPWYEGKDIIEEDPDQRYLTSRITQDTIDFIERHQDKPFFAYVPHAMPHKPLAASPRFRGKSKAGLYGDVIEELDWSVGAIMDKIDSLGLKEKTIIMFSSDNGGVLVKNDPEYGSSFMGPLRGHKNTSWDGGHRVPFIVRWPGSVP